MNKSLLKFVTDFGPLLVFLLFYYNSDKNLKTAIPPFIIATILALIVVWILEKRIPMIPLIGGILITLFGGLTIYFDNPDRKSTRLNSSHKPISYAVFCLKKKNKP